jgi:quinoprotein glucose dehydrogenase
VLAVTACATNDALQSGHDPASAYEAGADWPYYNGGAAGTHYSRLGQINTTNVKDLKVAWTFESGDAFGKGVAQSDMESNPLVVGGVLYFISPKGRLIALDGVTGTQLWAYDPAEGHPVRTKQRLRGVAYWSDGNEARILFTFRQNLLAVEARSGRLIQSFGRDGKVDLRAGLGRDLASLSVSSVTPGAIYKDLIIMGSTGNAPGHVRAYDVHTGAIRWIFHTIPQPGEPGYETWPQEAWKSGMGANVWAGFSVDPERGLVFLPVASAGMADKDYYGADRRGDNLFGTSLVALDANTGRRIWSFQMVKHDLWDRDLPTPPTLVTVKHDDRSIPALAQVTKAGLLFILDRSTGKPLFPVEERTAPQTDIPGESSAPTQVLALVPEPFTRQHLTEDLLTQRTPQAHAAAIEAFSRLRSRGPFDPPSRQGTIIFPGPDGGAEWGGAAYDPATGLLYINANEMAGILKLKPRPPQSDATSGRSIYLNRCAACHGEDRAGSPPEFPDLRDVGQRLTELDMMYLVGFGSGRMPAFGLPLGAQGVKSVVTYLRTGVDDSRPPSSGSAEAAKTAPAALESGDDFVFERYAKFLDPDGYPAITPPWGTLSAVNVNTGAYAWKIPFGEYPELAAAGIEPTGSENYGGAVVTAGGLLFIGATVYDNKFHAYDKRTGQLLWQTTLPAAGCATPATYLAKGRQFIVIAAGGGKNMKGANGGQIIAFALPNHQNPSDRARSRVPQQQAAPAR